MLYDSGRQKYELLLKRAGGWRTESYNEFYTKQNCEWVQVPSFHFDKLYSAIFQNRVELLPPDTQVLAFCMEFEYEIRDGLQEVLASSSLFHMIEALRQIEAQQYADLLLHIMQNDFHNEQFPLSDEQIERMQNQIEKADKVLWNNKSAYDVFHKAVVTRLITRLDYASYIF